MASDQLQSLRGMAASIQIVLGEKAGGLANKHVSGLLGKGKKVGVRETHTPRPFRRQKGRGECKDAMTRAT